MKKGGFLSTEMGRLTLAGILVLIAFPIIYCGIRLSIDALSYVGLAAIIIGMGIAPVFSLLHREKP